MVGRQSLADIASEQFALLRAARFEVGQLSTDLGLLPRLTSQFGYPL
jgi:hypothetical protein